MNKHITENLNHYIELENPEYAILLSGKWGSGKTYFIDNYISDIMDKYTKGSEENKIKFIKISLFGLSKVENIDEIIFQKLHPVLGSQYAKFTGSMLRSALRIGLNFDVDSDGKSDGRLSIDPKDFSFFSDDKKSSKELIFIFDDLERTDIGLSEILGYINYLVEQSNFKVIILANADEIEDKKKFKSFKEKIIGKTFEIKQDLDDIFENFFKIVTESKDELLRNKEQIKKVFLTAEYNNLRHIRQTVLDFEYVYCKLDNRYKSHSMLMEDLIKEFFIFSIEVKSGKLDKDDFIMKDTRIEDYANATF